MRTVRIGDVVDSAQSGFASGKRDESGVIQLRMNNVDTTGVIDLSEHIRVPVDEKQIDRYSLKENDILFNNTNSTELVGKSAIFRSYAEPVVFSNHFTRIRVNNEQADSEFLCFYINHLWQKKVFIEICQRWIGQSSVNFNKLAILPIALPDLHEQRQVAARLKAQLAEVEVTRKKAEDQLEAINRLPAAYLRDAFEPPAS